MLGERRFNNRDRGLEGMWGDHRGTKDLVWERREWRSEPRQRRAKEEPRWKPKQGRMGWRIQA